MPNWLSCQRGTEETSLATTSGNSSEAEERYLGTSACTIGGLHLTASFLGEKSAVRPRRRTWSCCRKSRSSNIEGLWHYRSISGSRRHLAGFVSASGATESNKRQFLNSRVPSGQDGQSVHTAVTEGAAVGPGHNAADGALGAGELWPGRC